MIAWNRAGEGPLPVTVKVKSLGSKDKPEATSLQTDNVALSSGDEIEWEEVV